MFSFSLTNAAVGITRTFDSFSQAADEASASRIFAGQHFRYDEDAGQTLGGQVADFVLDHALRARPPRSLAIHGPGGRWTARARLPPEADL